MFTSIELTFFVFVNFLRMDLRILEVIQGLCLSLLYFLDNAIYGALLSMISTSLFWKKSNMILASFYWRKLRSSSSLISWMYFSWTKFFIWILFYWGFRESFLIIIKLGRWSIILFTKFPLKMVLSYVMTKTLSTKDVLLWLMIPIGLLIHGCTKKMT